MILRKLDFVGFLLLLAASVFLVTALEEAGTQYKWSSALVVILLVLAALSWLGVIGWSWFVDHKETSVEPVFTWRFLQNRVFMGALLYVESHLSGSKLDLGQRADTFLQQHHILRHSFHCGCHRDPSKVPSRKRPFASSGWPPLSALCPFVSRGCRHKQCLRLKTQGPSRRHRDTGLHPPNYWRCAHEHITGLANNHRGKLWLSSYLRIRTRLEYCRPNGSNTVCCGEARSRSANL